MLNESGAYIFRQYMAGNTADKIAEELYRPLRQIAVNGIGIGGIETPVREFAPNDVA